MLDNATAEGPTIRIPRARTLEDRLKVLLAEKRPAFVAKLKALRQKEMQKIADFQLEAINETTGLDVATNITVVTDSILRLLVDRAFIKAEAPSNWQETVGIFALGGYGRGELAPESDIDLLVLHTGSRPEWLQNANQELQTLLWDIGFQVGASMRQNNELERILSDDHVTATAVLEQRLLVGTEAMDDLMRTIRERFRKKRGKAFLRYKVDELRERQQKAGANLFTMEPNTKTNPGCLRDIQFLRNASFILFGSRNLHALRDIGVVNFDDIQRLFEANDQLLGMRCLLHARHQRHEDRLSLQDQLWLADCYGYATGGRVKAVEQMMRQHYERVLHVHQIAELTISRLHALGHLGRRLILVKTRKKLNQDFTIIDKRVYLANPRLWEAADLGNRLLDMCRLTQQKRLRMSVELQRSIKRNLHRLVDHPFIEDPESGRTMLTIMGDLGYLRPILEDMHWSGLLGAYLPEFGNLTALLQFNSYHQYTADEHTLVCIQNLDRLAEGQAEGFAGCRQILAGVERPDLLALALLLHDVGKFMGSGHVPRGALMIGPVARRMGLDEQEEDIVHFLVAEHVTLSDATRFRDIHDPDFLKRLATAMGDRSRLDLLYVLTWCDITGVGEGVMTGWQEAIAKELYDNIALLLVDETVESGFFPPKRQRLIRGMTEGGLSAAAAEAMLERMADTYVYEASPDEVLGHHQLLKAAAEDGDAIAITHQVIDEAASIQVACGDKHGLFADITGTISALQFDITEARTWVTSDGYSLYSARVTCAIPARLDNDQAWNRLYRSVRAVLKGETTPKKLQASQSGIIAYQQPANSGFDSIEVTIDQRLSNSATVVDVRVKDQPGILYAIASTIAELECDLRYASIATYGDVARDVFYITHDGHKLNPQIAGLLRREIADALAECCA